MNEDFEQIRREGDDANVIYALERLSKFKGSHSTLFVHAFNEAQRVRRVIIT